MSGRLRQCWLEQRDRDKLMVLCVVEGTEPPKSIADAFTRKADRSIVLPKSSRRWMNTRTMSGVIEAVEYVRREKLGHVLDLLREGYIVTRGCF